MITCESSDTMRVPACARCPRDTCCFPISSLVVGIYNPHSASLQRFEKLCRCVLSSMDAENEPKVSGMGVRSLSEALGPVCLALKFLLNVRILLGMTLHGYIQPCV